MAGPDLAHRRRVVGLGVVTAAAAVALLPIAGSSWVATAPGTADERATPSTAPPSSAPSSAPSPGSASPASSSAPSPSSPSQGPASPASPAPPAAAGGPAPLDALTATHTVRWGETLTSIGTDHGMTWREVFEANTDVIGADPNLVVAGTVLRVRPA